jgi:hypothetical protein
VNFYEQRDYYPGYLLCTYDVSERHYDPSNEPDWFESALRQIRNLGSQTFPPFEWVALNIRNRAESKDRGTTEECYKAGAIFNSNDVFDLKQSLQDVIAKTGIDRHPLQYDPKRPTPGEKERWLSVEQHLTKSKERKDAAPN